MRKAEDSGTVFSQLDQQMMARIAREAGSNHDEAED